MHSPPFLHTVVLHSAMLLSQKSPRKPFRQVHTALPLESSHVPPFWHGVCSQGLINVLHVIPVKSEIKQDMFTQLRSKGQGHKVVNVNFMWKCLAKGTWILDMNTVTCTDQKLLA